MFSAVDDDHFRYFAGSLERAIAEYDDEDKAEQQKRQMEALMALEVDFRSELIGHKLGVETYDSFIGHICDVQKNILDARPYFRERHERFSDEISDVLKARNAMGLYPFRINYQFIAFVMGSGKFVSKTRLARIARQIEKLRNEIIVTLLPIGVNRARVFFRRTPKSHLQHMDLIQIACEGLMNGIDKYCPDEHGFSVRQFRSTVIGRMGGNFIADYSQPLIHFYPADKRKLYRANKSARRYAGAMDYQKLSEAVNDGVKKTSHQTNPIELADLMAAASTVSADSSLPSDPDAPEPIDRFAAPESTRPDRQVEERASMELLFSAFQRLTPYEQKFLRLKGVRFDERSLSMQQ